MNGLFLLFLTPWRGRFGRTGMPGHTIRKRRQTFRSGYLAGPQVRSPHRGGAPACSRVSQDGGEVTQTYASGP